MGDKTGIQWTDATWNPLVGCSLVSPGCTNCYAMGQASWIAGMKNPKTPQYRDVTKKVNGIPVWTGKVNVAEHLLDQPKRWKRPRMIFTNSMSDLFHESVSRYTIDAIFAVMAECPQHIFQVLTKRPHRMREYMLGLPGRRADLDCHSGLDWSDWPLKNVWLGTSVEDQKRADERIPQLLATPAAVRFISAEPLLGPVDLSRWTTAPTSYLGYCDAVGGPAPDGVKRLDWIIVGAESGDGARPMDVEWARKIKDQCTEAGVAFFLKQYATPSGKKIPTPELDGQTWTEMPGALSAA